MASSSDFFVRDSGPAVAPSGPAAGSAFTPNVTGHQRGTPAPKCEPHCAFVLTHHPNRWGVQGGKIRPILGRMPLVSGIGGCEDGPNGTVKAGTARNNTESKGWTLIPYDSLPKSQAHRGSYLYSLKDSGRPDVILPYWARAYAGSTALRADLDLKYEFLDHLVSSGVVPEVPTYVIERCLDDAKARFERAADKAQTVPSWKPKAKAIGDEVKVLEKELKARAVEPVAVGGGYTPETSGV